MKYLNFDGDKLTVTKERLPRSYESQCLFVRVVCERNFVADFPETKRVIFFGWQVRPRYNPAINPLGEFLRKAKTNGLLWADGYKNIDAYTCGPTLRSQKRKYGLRSWSADDYVRVGVPFEKLYQEYYEDLLKLKNLYKFKSIEQVYYKLLNEALIIELNPLS